MKKVFLLIAAVAMIGLAGCQKTAADSTESDIPGYNEKDDPNSPSGVDDASVSPEKQIEETAKALMAALDINNWRDDAEFIAKVIRTVQSKDYDDDKLEEWVDALTEGWQQAPRQEGNTKYYDYIVRLSDAKGHFEEQADGTFSFTEADDFQITILVDGEKVTGTFSCTDTKVPLRITSSGGNNYDYQTGTEYYEYHSTYVYVPSSAKLKVLRGSAEFASLELTADVDVKDPEQVNPYTDSATLTATLKFSVYTLVIQKLAYSPTGADINIKLLSGNASLITVTAKAQYELDPASNDSVPVKSGNVDAYIDVMGKIQLKGSIPDFALFMSTGQSMSSKRDDANAFKALVAQLEGTFSVGMYFNGAAEPRATLGLEASQIDGSYWTCDPVIRFSDGTSYKLEEYFSEERFGDLIIYARNWWEGIQNYITNLFGGNQK